MPTKTKKDFVDTIAEKYGLKQSTVKTVIHSFINEITKELSNGNRLEFRDFGVFEVRETAPQMA